MNQSITYLGPVVAYTADEEKDESVWDAAVAAYQEEDYLGAIGLTLKYLAPGLVPEGDLTGKTVELVHGSVKLFFSVSENGYKVRAPFVVLPSGGRAIALMRKALELCGELEMARFFLEGEELSIVAEDELIGSHPAKLLSMMSSMCRIADSYDDLFEKQFGATRLEPVKVDNWQDDVLEQAYQAFQEIIEQGIAHATMWEAKQNLRYAYFALDTAGHRLAWALHPQGELRATLNKWVDELRNGSKPPAQRITSAKKELTALAATPKEKVAESLYNARFILPDRDHVSQRWLVEQIGDAMKAAKNARKDREFELAASIFLHVFYENLRSYHFSRKLESVFVQGLTKASGLPWREAAESLSELADAIAACSDESEESTGDFYQGAMEELDARQRQVEGAN